MTFSIRRRLHSRLSDFTSTGDFPTARIHIPITEFWKTPLGPARLTPDDYVRRMGTALRDPEEAPPSFDSLADMSPPPQRGGLSRGGGVGGVGGAGRRGNARGLS